MRIWGRVTNPDGSRSWVAVETNPVTGDNSYVYLTQLCQVLLLNLGESPFYASYGLPAEQSLIAQVSPDYYMARVQQQFAQYFASLVVTKTQNSPPAYSISVVFFNGVTVNVTMQVPY